MVNVCIVTYYNKTGFLNEGIKAFQVGKIALRNYTLYSKTYVIKNTLKLES